MNNHSETSTLEQIRNIAEQRLVWWRSLSPVGRAVFLATATLLLLFLRRPFQFLHPDVWVEDGTHLIPDTYLYGARAIPRPVNGYMVLVPRIINLVAMQVPLEYYPEVSTILAVLLNILVVLAVASSPTVLRHRTLCAIFVLMVPIDSEVYALPSYTFWIVSLLPVLALLWRPGDGGWGEHTLRTGYIVVGGLSSPFSIALMPLFVLRLLFVRTRGEVVGFFAAVTVTVVQIRNVLPKNAPRIEMEAPAEFAQLLLVKFFGYFVSSHFGQTVAILSGTAVSAIVLYSFAGALKGSKEKQDGIRCFLYGLLPLAIGSSVARAPIGLINPIDGGPRYFFLPYVFLAWILLNPPAASPILKKAGRLILVLAVLNGAAHFVRPQDPTNWREAVREYRTNGSATLPVHYTGEGETWKLEFPPRDWEESPAREATEKP